MKMGIIGAGFTGISAGLHLAENGHEVKLIEKDEKPGGLAVGFRVDQWNWTLEKHYHHFFTNDSTALLLAKKIGHPIVIKRPKTSIHIDNKIYQLDSPLKVLTFSKLNFFERIRMATILGLLRYNPFWKPLEKIKAVDFLSKTIGKKAYETVWEPQLSGKFGKYMNEISLAWFWARVRKRTAKLAYPEYGFLNFAENVCNKIIKSGGSIVFSTEVTEIEDKKNKVLVKTSGENGKHSTYEFDKVIITLPSFLFLKLVKNLPEDYKKNMARLKSLGAINLVLRLKKPFFKDDTYWLSICDKKSPIMAIVEHTNFINKKNYGQEHIIYVGKYLPPQHPYFSKTAEELLEIYDPYLEKINKNYKDSIIAYHLFKDPFAQPIISVNYSAVVPVFNSPLKNIYIANIQQVYPWDRGTNYAIELGEKVAKII